jgi:alpha-1,3-rhamnosyl/mannosyltransferase
MADGGVEAGAKSVPPVLAIDASRMSGARAGIDNYLFHLLPRLVAGWQALPPGGGARRVWIFTPPAAEQGGFVAGVAPRRSAAGAQRDSATGDPRDSAAAAGAERDSTSGDPRAAAGAAVLPPPDLRPGGGPGWTQLRLPLACRGAAVYFSPIPILPLLLPMPCPAVVTVHDFHEMRPRWGYYRRLLARTFRRAARIICVSETSEAELREEFPWAASRTTVVHEAADGEVFRPPDGAHPEPPSAELERLGIHVPPLLAVGTIQPRKNLETLIRAYARLPPGAPPLLIVGKPGWEHEAVMELPRRLAIADRVTFAGHLPTAELAAIMRQSRLLCALSTAEGFGLPLVEAMASGLPILASDIPPFREVAGNAARFVAPTDEAAVARRLGELLADAPLRAELSEVGRRRSRLFSWDRAAEAVLAELERARTARRVL